MTANSAMPSQTMPTLFVPHGAGPCFFMEWNPRHAWDAMADFLKGIAATLPAKPTAIVLGFRPLAAADLQRHQCRAARADLRLSRLSAAYL